MTNEELLVAQESFIKKLSEFFPYKPKSKTKDFTKLDALNLSINDRKYAATTINASLKFRRVSPLRCLTLLCPLFSSEELMTFQKAQQAQEEKNKASKKERAIDLHTHKKMDGRSFKTFKGGIKEGTCLTTTEGVEVRILQQTEFGNYIVETLNTHEKRLLGRDDLRLVKAKFG